MTSREVSVSRRFLFHHLRSPQLSKKKFRTAAMLSVFIVSAVVHEYALAMGFGFFYPVMFCLFAIFGGNPQISLEESHTEDCMQNRVWLPKMKIHKWIKFYWGKKKSTAAESCMRNRLHFCRRNMFIIQPHTNFFQLSEGAHLWFILATLLINRVTDEMHIVQIHYLNRGYTAFLQSASNEVLKKIRIHEIAYIFDTWYAAIILL